MLDNFGNEDGWYERAQGYTVDKYELHQAKYRESQKRKALKKEQRKNSLFNRAIRAVGGINNVVLFFFFALNVVLAVWSFLRVKQEFSLWYLSMGIYYCLLAVLRFLIIEHKPAPFNNIYISEYTERRISGFLFYAICFLLPFILILSIVTFTRSGYDTRIVLAFLFYTIFKASTTVSKFLIASNFDTSPFSTLNSTTYVELGMALLTMGRYWLVYAGENSFALVLIFYVVVGVAVIMAIGFLGHHSYEVARQLKRRMSAAELAKYQLPLPKRLWMWFMRCVRGRENGEAVILSAAEE